MREHVFKKKKKKEKNKKKSAQNKWGCLKAGDDGGPADTDHRMRHQ